MQLSSWRLKLWSNSHSLLPFFIFFLFVPLCEVKLLNHVFAMMVHAPRSFAIQRQEKKWRAFISLYDSGVRSCFFYFSSLPSFPLRPSWMASTVMDGCQDNLQKTAQFLSLKAVFHNGKRHIGSCFVNCVKCKLLAHFPEPRLTWKLFETTWCLDVTFTQCFNFETYRHIIGFYNPGEMPHLR